MVYQFRLAVEGVLKECDLEQSSGVDFAMLENQDYSMISVAFS
jgi:hypothetical protein